MVKVSPNSLARRLGAMPLTFARAAPSLLRVTSTCCDLGKTHTCLNSVCGAKLAECIWQPAERDAARCFCTARLRRHGKRPRRRRVACAPSSKTARNVFHQRSGRCGVSLLSALLSALCIGGQRQRDSSRAWRGCARRDVAARHDNVRIFACVGCHVCVCIL